MHVCRSTTADDSPPPPLGVLDDGTITPIDDEGIPALSNRVDAP